MQDRPGIDGSDEDESSFSASETNSSSSTLSLNRGAEENLETNDRSDERSTRDVHVALPREHSYLEESHPLLPDADRYRRSSYASSGSGTPGKSFLANTKPDQQHRRPTNTNTHELAILELHGVVLFPGSTIPVKLRNRSMIRYLGKQIQLCRTDPVAQPRVLLGILPYEGRSQPRPPSQPRPIQQRSFEFERARQRRRHNDNERGGRGGERILRGSWMRQRFSFGNGEIAPTASSHRLRQSLTRMRDEFQFLDSDDNSESESGDDMELHYFDENDDEEEHGGTSPSQHQIPKSSHPLVGQIGTIATVQHTHERTTGMRSGGSTSSGVNSSPASSLWGSYEEATELVFTAVGTSRFRILSCINDEEDIFEVEELAEASPLRPPFSSVLLPFRGIRATRPLVDGGEDEKSETKKEAAATTTTVSTRLPTLNERRAWNLSQLTPLPYFLYRHRMPWSLVEKITTALKTNDGRDNLPSLGDDSIVTNRTKLEPRIFSYWMANNGPFSESERKKLLRMDSVLERLLYIWKAVEKLTSKTTLSQISCGICAIPLARTSQIFMVGGAEGTTSAYVNGHGFIHQITTLRKVIYKNRISFREFPSTENSYFPGYSWLITCCDRCESMLGWKFQKVALYDRQNESDDGADDNNNSNNEGGSKRVIDRDTPERPPYFYGFMASNVNIEIRTAN